MLFAVLLMGLIRPHISAIVLAALAITVITDRRTNIVLRVLFFGAAALGVVYSLASISATYQVNLANPDAIGDQLAGREAIVQGEKGDSAGNSVVDVIYPLRILSLLFRPLFFDANGLLPLIVSFENVAVLLIVGTLAWHWRTTWRLMKAVPFVRFALLSATGTLLALALTYYNIGLGIRQKSTMILPGILVGFVALRAVLAIRAEQQAGSQLPADAPVNRAPVVAAVPGLLYGRSGGRDL
jgi:small neutral amino acid transporter SnatA (MarC family)